jgi:hypothetical protein
MLAICSIGPMLLQMGLESSIATQSTDPRLQRGRDHFFALNTDFFLQPTGSLSALTVPVLRRLLART